MQAVKKVTKMPIRRSERLRNLQKPKDAGPAPPKKRGPPRRLLRGRARTQRQLAQAQEHQRNSTTIRPTVNRDLYTVISSAFNNNNNNNSINNTNNNEAGSDDEDDEQSMQLTAFLMYIALTESPSLAELWRRNQAEGIRKLLRIIRFLFSRN
ncbi:hypothetical protein ACLKA7_016114 [Drosophila subpalustris]